MKKQIKKVIVLARLKITNEIIDQLMDEKDNYDKVIITDGLSDQDQEKIYQFLLVERFNYASIDEKRLFALMNKAVKKATKIADIMSISSGKLFFHLLFGDGDYKALMAKYAISATFDWMKYKLTIKYLATKYPHVEVWTNRETEQETRRYQPVLMEKAFEVSKRVTYKYFSSDQFSVIDLVKKVSWLTFRSKSTPRVANKSSNKIAIYFDPRSRNYWFDQSLTSSERQLARNPMFLDDNKRLRKSNVLVILPEYDNPFPKKILTNSGFKVITFPKIKPSVDWGLLKISMINRWMSLVKFYIWFYRLPRNWQGMINTVFHQALTWHRIVKDHDFAQLISWDDYYDLAHIVRYLVLDVYEKKTVFIQNSYSFLNIDGQYVPGDAFGQLRYHRAFIGGEETRKHFLQAGGKFDELIEVGIVGAEIVARRRQFLKSQRKNFLINDFRKKIGSRPVITVFDESIISFNRARIFINDKEILTFFDDLLWLAQTNPSWYFIIKPKYEIDCYDRAFKFYKIKAGNQCWRKFKNLENVMVFDHKIDPYLAIALGDLVITPYTSTSTVFFEAIASGTPSFYYLPTPKQVVKSLPIKYKIRAVGRKELTEFCKYWLTSQSVTTKLAQLNRALMDFDAYGDDMALSRILNKVLQGY